MGVISYLKASDSIASVYRLYKAFKIRYFYNLRNVHRTFNIGGKSKISTDFKAEEYSYVGPNCLIYPGVSIGRYTILAQNVQIIGGDHRFDAVGIPITFSGRDEVKPTNIGKDVWIGANAIVLTGVTIGDGAIIAAGSVVTKDLPSYTISAGVPAKPIKKRFDNLRDEVRHSLAINGKVLKNIRNKPMKLS